MALRPALFSLCLATVSWLPAPPVAAAPPTESDLTAAAAKFQGGMEKLQAGDMSGLSDMRSAYDVLESALGRNAEPVVQMRTVLVTLYDQLGMSSESAALKGGSSSGSGATTEPTPKSMGPEEVLALMQGALEDMSAGRMDAGVAKMEKLEKPLDEMAASGNPMAIGLQSQIKLGLGQAYMASGRLDEAEERMEAALKIMRAQSGENDITLLNIIENLQFLALMRGDAKKVEELNLEVMRLAAANPTHPKSIQVTLQYAEFALMGGDLKQAATLWGVAYAGATAVEPPHYAEIFQIHLLGVRLADEGGNTAKAEEQLAAAEAVMPLIPKEAIAGSHRVDLLQARAGHAKRVGKYGEAASAYEQVLAMDTAYTGAQAIGGALLYDAAEAHWIAGAREEAARRLDESAGVYDDSMARILSGGTDEQKQMQLLMINSSTALVHTLVQEYGLSSPPLIQLGLRTALRRKGRILDSQTDALRAVRQHASEEDKALLDQLGQVRAQIANESYGGDDPEAVTSLREHEKELEKQLNARSAALGEFASPVEIDEVRDRLPSESALVEIVAYQQLSKKVYEKNFKPESRHYLAYVLPKSGAPRLVDLGEVPTIDAKVAAARKAMANPGNGEFKKRSRELDAAVMEPIRGVLGSAEHLLIAPDGNLNLVPFGALVDGDGKYLIERNTITYLSSGRDLLRLADTTRATGSALLMGNPDFGPKPTAEGALNFTPLPGTADEIVALGKVMKDAQVLTQSSADEGEFKEVARPKLLHVATHGFFLKGMPDGGVGTRGLELSDDSEDEKKLPKNPLLRSGIALSGANSGGGDGNDGILTALELSNMDLWGTEMVVLSACETGVGQVNEGEGVYGLRRALVVAGSRSQVMSLWKVDDEATRDLMIDFYKKLKKGKGRSEALREVQLAMLKKKDTAHPHFWAAFIPSGDWAPVDIKAKKDDPEPRRGDVRDYWRDKLDDPLLYMYGGYSSPIALNDFQGGKVTSPLGVGVHMDTWVHPRLAVRLGYDHAQFEIGDSTERNATAEIRQNRLEVGFLVDVLALPYYWKVRPSLSGILGGGIGWAKEAVTTIDPTTMMPSGEPTDDTAWGIGGVWGGEFGLHLRFTEKVDLKLRGGVTQNAYRFSGDPDVETKGGFGRAWRWEAGAALGFVLE